MRLSLKPPSAPSLTITSSQLRAARALVDWSRAQCSQASGVSPETIKNIEQEKFIPAPITVEKIVKAFAGVGVEFFSLHGVALRDGTPNPTLATPQSETR